MPIRYIKRILIVDNEEDIVISLGSILKRANYEVISATSGQEALKLAREKTPDLIILDIIMPDIDGGGVANILSEGAATANIPVIFLTGILSKEEELLGQKEGGRKSGSYYMMAKPVSKDALLDMINKILTK